MILVQMLGIQLTGANFAVTVIGAFIIDFILGAIGGVIGVLIKGESSVEPAE